MRHSLRLRLGFLSTLFHQEGFCLIGGITLIFLAAFISLGYAKEISSNQINPPKLNPISIDTTLGFNHPRLTVEVEKSSNLGPGADVKKAIDKSLDYFFIGLALPDEKFWVNLNPSDPYKIIDSALADTGLGRLMLYADLQLKKDISQLMNPQAQEAGKEYWSRLYQKGIELGVAGEIPVTNKVWVVPEEAEVYETENQFSIVKGKLKVYLEPLYSSQNSELKDERQKELKDYALGLMQELIMPRLNEIVNESPAYADLREAYRVLILARWYKNKFQQNGALQNIGSSVIKDAEVSFLYGRDQIYREYLSSFKKTQYNFQDGNNATMQYFIGGVDFRNIKFVKTNSPLKNPASQGGATYTAEFSVPDDVGEGLLQYAKNTVKLTPVGEQHKVTLAFFEKLPPMAKFVAQIIGALETHNIDRATLSKL